MTVLLYVAAYVIGSIPTAIIVGKLFYGVDIRNHGSNNPGATNTVRVLGKRAGVIVLIGDIGKGALAAALPYILHVDADPLLIGLVAVLGHCFPIFANFRGGKAIATTAGTLLIANPWMLVVAYVSFFGVIFATKYVFMGSISVGVALFIYSLLEPGQSYELIFFFFILFLIFLHRSNIRNFKAHKEPKVNDKNLKNDRISKKK
ncbi:glycerol-3-phosphate 1-O-acyltransferase PlsY [Robertmurraya andreesenii]|uniref:Glycerol-3-phosphate acyltransferase n=1 Tax=Anoxybacillus andreesenii TaxID=1325932 RepID=A0ABT9V7C1_9BACL|nr:glycerol-3-phosphate 1-O-acyltransferase PlsY [Robertmurraya andreesenii]MDQ0156850.1 glycerol-3-phosphate acyltransferase PlsY [Robertmurraya andreesenii]